jgi:periplasmic divalent cation tolerance protein
MHIETSTTGNQEQAMQYCLIFCSCPDETTADQIAKSLLEQQQAACVHITPLGRSLYIWNNKLEQTQECQLVIKTHHTHFDAVRALIKTQHPYECPEILEIPIQAGDDKYMQWLQDTLGIHR